MLTTKFLPSLDNQQRRIFRLAFGVAASSAVAIGFSWPLSYLVPMLMASILGASDAALGIKKAVAMLVIIFVGLFSGIIFSSLFIAQPVLASLLLAIIFYWIYYFSHSNVLPNFAAIMLIIGMTIIPLMSQIDTTLAMAFSYGILVAAAVAIVFSALSYCLFPHDTSAKSDADKIPVVANTKAQSRRIAGISTLVVMPAVILFLTFNLLSSALIIVFIAILSLNPVLEQGRKAGVGLLLGNALGGLVAMIFYTIMTSAPYYLFYVVLLSVFALYMAREIHSSKKSAALWGMALSTLLVLTGPIFSGEGAEASDKFSTRILQISAAAFYIVMAFRMTAELWEKVEPDNAKVSELK